MLWMMPPVAVSRASRSRSRSAVGVWAGNTFARSTWRSAAPGNGNVTTNRSRRRNAWSSALSHVGRQDRQAAVGLHPLQQVVDLDVGVAVVAVLDLAALAEQRVGLVEEQDRAAALSAASNSAAQVLLGLADVLADHGGQVDAVEVEPQLVGDDLGGHRLAGAARAGEQRADAEPAASSARRSPSRRRRSLRWRTWSAIWRSSVELGLGQHEVVPGRLGRRSAARARRGGAGVAGQASHSRGSCSPASWPAAVRAISPIVGDVEVELAGQRRWRVCSAPGAERAQPGRALLGRRRLGDVDRSTRQAISSGHGSRRERGTAPPLSRQEPPDARACRCSPSILGVRVEVERERQQQALALPQPRQGLQVGGLCRQQVRRPAGRPARRAVAAASAATSCLLGGVRAEQLDHRAPARLRRSGSSPRARPRRRSAATAAGSSGGAGHGGQQGREPVVEVVESLEVVDDPLVGAQRARRSAAVRAAG